MPESAPAIAFEKAKAAFDAGDFATARAYASDAEHQILAHVNLRKPAAKVSPLCSIVVVTQGQSADLDNLLMQIGAYLEPDFELILVVNGNDGLHAARSRENMTVVDVGFNYGCSGGRNIGARLSRGQFVMFLDDDGVLEQGALESLIARIRRYDAIAVRGRVIPRSDHASALRHYDYGDEVMYSVPNTEGISIWRREQFLHFGGFDTLLAGHEGVALCSTMYRFYGPDAFLYDPAAILHHDYAKNESQLEAKKRRLAFNATYLDYAYPNALALRAALHARRKDMRTRIFFADRQYTTDTYAPEASLAQSGVTVLTVAKDASPLLADYTQALKNQTFTNFEVIFVDGASSDGTADRILSLWKNDDRLRLEESAGNRAQCFNLALSKATHDICVIAEVGDISLPRRLELTARYFRGNSLGCLSFAEFTERELFSGANWPTSVGLRTRSLLGQAAFGTLSFRKSQFAVPFDVSVAAGCEGKWMRDNLDHRSVDGAFVPLHAVFRGSDKDIADAELQAIRESALALLYSAQEQLLGPLSEEDRWCCRVLGGLEDLPTKTNISVIENYILRLIAKNAEKRIYDQNELQDLLVARMLRLETQKLRTLNGRYKRELRRLRELCSNYEQQLESLKANRTEEPQVERPKPD